MRDRPYCLDSSLMLMPAICLARISLRWAGVVLFSRPSVLRCCFALSSPAWVRSTRRSRSISPTAVSMVSIIFPAGEVKSSLPSCRTITSMRRAASALIVAPTSSASRPRRPALRPPRFRRRGSGQASWQTKDAGRLTPCRTRPHRHTDNSPYNQPARFSAFDSLRINLWCLPGHTQMSP